MIIYTPEARRLHEPFRGSARTAHLPPAGCWATALLPRKLSGMLRSGPPFARLVRPEDSVCRFLALSIERRNEPTRAYHGIYSPALLVNGGFLAASLPKTLASAAKAGAPPIAANCLTGKILTEPKYSMTRLREESIVRRK